MRSLLFVLALLPLGCSQPSPTIDDQKALANLKSQAAEVGQAMLKENHARMAELTHPALLKLFGGREAYLKKLDEMANDLRRQGMKFQSFDLGTPSALRESEGVVYAIYPYSLQMTMPNGQSARQPAYLICTSSDGGATWKFLDGAGVKDDRSKLKQVLPRFPDDLALPQPKPLERLR